MGANKSVGKFVRRRAGIESCFSSKAQQNLFISIETLPLLPLNRNYHYTHLSFAINMWRAFKSITTQHTILTIIFMPTNILIVYVANTKNASKIVKSLGISYNTEHWTLKAVTAAMGNNKIKLRLGLNLWQYNGLTFCVLCIDYWGFNKLLARLYYMKELLQVILALICGAMSPIQN